MPLSLSAPPGTRFPDFGDEELLFEPKGALKGRLDWAEVLAYHAPGYQRFNLLALHEESISAVACFEVRETDLFLDYLARNGLFRPRTYVSGGSILVAAVEQLAQHLELAEIRLDCVKDIGTIEWYEQKGFLRDGPARLEPGWGKLFPMVKSVGHFGAL